MPDLDKIIKLSSIFGVSTDYLLKGEKKHFMIRIIIYMKILNASMIM